MGEAKRREAAAAAGVAVGRNSVISPAGPPAGAVPQETSGFQRKLMFEGPPIPVQWSPGAKWIFIAIPCHSGKPSHMTMIACQEAEKESAARGWKTTTYIRSGDSILVRARDVLFSMFLKSQCTDMLFVDGDIGWDPCAFSRILSHPVDVVGGVYPGRGDPPQPVVRPLFRPDGTVSMEVHYPSGLAEVEGVGTGFLRITRRAAECIAKSYEDCWYTDHTAPDLTKIYHVFDFKYNGKTRQLFSEDYVFCQRWRDLGGKVFVDVTLPLHHEGMKTYSMVFEDYLKAEAAKPNGSIRLGPTGGQGAPGVVAAAPQRLPSLADAAMAMLED